jgi:uncharacterized membrane protein
MNLAHLHLLLNHWPIIGTFIGLGLFLVSLLGKSDDLKQASLAGFPLIALLAIPTYISGNAAQDVIQQEQGVSRTLITTHQGAALLALVFMLITGAVAWLGLWQFRRRGHAAIWTLSAVLLCAIVTVGLMTITGNTGGEIRHPEILSNPQTTSIIGTLGFRLDESTELFVTGTSRWVWPVLEDLHFLGLALLLGATGILNLRLLGFLKQLPVGPLHRFVPWGIAGLAINVITGILFFLGMPFFYVYNLDFHIKVFAVVLAGANLVLYCTRPFQDCELVKAGEDAPPIAKFFAGSSIVLWIAVIVAGRYMPYFEETLRP